MNVIILGAGENGFYLAEELSRREHDVCVIESNETIAEEAREKLDARIVTGNGSTVTILEEAGVASCELFVALSSDDNTNLVAGSLAKALGAEMAVARVHASIQQEQWLFDYRERFGLDYLFSTEHLAAVELAKFLRNPDALIVEEMAGGKIELQQIEVEPRSKADGCKLINLGLPPRVRIGCIQRGNQLQIPRATTELISGDIITLCGNPRALQEALPAFRTHSPEKTEMKRVVIFGGGEYGLCLARMLENGPFLTRIIEKNPSRCEVLSRLLKNTTLINADATSIRILREEQIGEADFFVATSHDDEDNVMTCLQASDMGVPRCITLIHRADYAEVISRSGPRIGIAGAVSPRTATRRDLARFITGEKIHTLTQLPGGIDIIEFNIRKNSPLIGKRVSQVPWPEGSGLVALARGSSANVPAAEDELREGDMVIAIVSEHSRKDFAKVIA